MQIYKVGGAVRDRLLGIDAKDQDWVVTGAVPEDLLRLGYQRVGADFPVFLHPVTHEEYALARTERKAGAGYQGFECFFSPDVTLEEDLKRRDLTINAMAMDAEGKIVDPYGGQQDLSQGILRHVSSAFTEDPLRILRVARFLARFSQQGFVIAPETLTLMQQIALSGELSTLTAERVWQETHQALQEATPTAYFEVLRATHALAVLFPEIDALFGVPQDSQHHPEVDTGIHTLLVLKQAAALSQDTLVRFAALTHDLGKALTPKATWPQHPGHEELGLKPLNALCDRLKIPNGFRKVAIKSCRWHTACHQALDPPKEGLLKTLNALEAFRTRDELELFLLTCQADNKGRPGYEDSDYPQAHFMLTAFTVIHAIEARPFVEAGLTGAAIGKALKQARLDALEQLKLAWEQ